jgi:hypothetical protein
VYCTASTYQTLRQYQQNDTTIVHYVQKYNPNTPKRFVSTIDEEEYDGDETTIWQECQLQIVEVNGAVPNENGEFPWNFVRKCREDDDDDVIDDITIAAAAAAGTAGTATDPYTHVTELIIDLLTGRTHQIRGQLAALDCPIVGDTLYRGSQPPPPQQQQQQYCDDDDDDRIRWRSYNTMALQCCYLSFPYPVPTAESDDDDCFSSNHKKERGQKQRRKRHNKNVLAVPSDPTKGIVVEYSLPTAWWSMYVTV